jgi:AbrB family looped-hinge helix DNA binding protein
METTTLSSKGQVIIPKSLRNQYKWSPGQKLLVIDKGNGIFLKPKRPFIQSSLKDVAGCLKYEGQAKSLKDMERAIKTGALKKKNDIR